MEKYIKKIYKILPYYLPSNHVDCRCIVKFWSDEN